MCHLAAKRDELEAELTYIAHQLKTAAPADAEILRDTYQAYSNSVRKINRQLGV